MAITGPNPYIPSFLKVAVSGSRPLTLTWADVSDTNIASTSSFQYDPYSTPLKSTQQLNVDWSQFQNHTFFMSAEAKVNLAFDAIINGFPFDGTRQETEFFFDNLSGFERWVFDNFPTFQGELTFSGTQTTETTPDKGSYIKIQNKTGALFPELSRNSSGQEILNPTGSQSMTVEMQLYLPAVTNDVQVVCQMVSGTVAGPATQGYTFYLAQSNSTQSVNGFFTIMSGSEFMTVTVPLNKGAFNHVAFVLNRDNGLPYLESYLLSQPASESPNQVEIGNMSIDNSVLLIGSGTAIQQGSLIVTPKQTFSGTLDEFRIFSSARTPAQMAAYASKALYSTPDLVLYYRFNEPPASFDGTTATGGINSIVLDSSGNSLHALISNFTSSLRLNSALDPLSPMVYERPDSVPVLFPTYAETLAFNAELLASASIYDQENPNLITKLIPQHYLLEGGLQDGFIDPIEGNEGQSYAGVGIPGQGKMGNVQILVSLLYIWARSFDDIKLFVDAFSTLRTVDYDTDDTIPDNFLMDLVKNMGFYLPPLFNDSDIEQYVRGENIDLQNVTTSKYTLKQVQTTLLRRVLVNLPDVLKSKGTQHSIKSFLRAVGIDPGNNIRIREFGGPTTQNLSFSRETKVEPGTMVQFTTASYVVSPFLTAQRVEPGYPGASGGASDELLTSGSWTWEGIVKYTPTSVGLMQSATQSLLRMCTTGSVSGSAKGSAGIIANLIAVSSSLQPKLVLYIRPGASSTSPMLRLEVDTPIPGYTQATDSPPGMFNYDHWNVSFGCQRNDDGLNSEVSSSYFLRLAYQNDGRIEYFTSTSSFFQENPSGENNALRTISAASNASGTYLSVGTSQLISAGTGNQYLHLNDNSVAPAEARVTDFNGRLSNFRYWSRALTENEWREHVRNYNSTGVEDPKINWNYATNVSGSWGRLRLNSLTRQDISRAVSTASITSNNRLVEGPPDAFYGQLGTIVFPDFSENGFHLTGSSFPLSADSVVADVFDMSFISPYFDEASCNDKVRIRSYQDFALAEQTPWAAIAPITQIPPSEQPTDDVRFVIEFSLIDALNRDIITMFSSLDSIDNAIGSPELVFSPDYPDLATLRDVYFNRIKAKLNFQAFFEFFRWFDNSIGTFIQQLIPRKTRFKGTNFTIESHMLERSKQEYLSYESYLGDSNRTNLDKVILLQQIDGTCTKY